MNTIKQIGVVRIYNDRHGYGFIKPLDGGIDCFVHYTAIKGDGFKTLLEGETVEYVSVNGKCGMQALSVSRKAA